MIILFLLSQVWSSYLDSTLSFIGLTKDDLGFRKDYTIRDSYRFAVVDELLSNPLNSIDFIGELEERFWQSSEPEVLKEFVELYGLNLKSKRSPFLKTLKECSRLLDETFRETPKALPDVFRELTLFSPDLTESIEEDKENEKRNDSLVNFLKMNGEKIDYKKLFTAACKLLLSIPLYESWLSEIEDNPVRLEGVEGSIVYYKRYEFGELVVGDTVDNVYKKNFAVIIDLGGNDVYHLDGGHSGRMNLIIDKSGDDLYEGGDYSIGCGHFGIGVLIDEQGDDCYRADNFSLGCGLFGVGILLDRKGDDRYNGDTFTQGAGGFGIGILKDEDGNDTYEGALYAQGFASTYGIGVIGDMAGNDRYLISEKYIDEIRYLDHYLSLSQGFSIGFRPDLSAGIGAIFDKAGNDSYIGDIFAQGSSYWYGIGAIVDDAGNDSYLAYQYAQGAGTHITIGLLVDKKGNDNYLAKGVSQGCGHDLSLGLLYDIEGDDSYLAFDLGQGAGNANGIGLLIDELGDDTYSVKRNRNTQGYGNFRREYGSIGVLMDIKGRDSYTEGGENSSLWKRGRYGIRIDWE